MVKTQSNNDVTSPQVLIKIYDIGVKFLTVVRSKNIFRSKYHMFDLTKLNLFLL